MRNEKMLTRMANQVALKHFRGVPKYKYGYQVPVSHREALWIDEKTGNTKWVDSEKLEIDQLKE